MIIHQTMILINKDLGIHTDGICQSWETHKQEKTNDSNQCFGVFMK